MRSAGPYRRLVTHDRALSALVVAVPEAEPVVGRHRALLDVNAALGVPAHVTVLFPFLAAEQLDDGALTEVATAVGAAPAFACSFARTSWFDDDVLWLAPTDPRPFRDLTARVFAAFPDHPPFGGAFSEVVPHLTVGHRHPRAVLEAAERDVVPNLPVTAEVSDVLLLVQDRPGGRWSPRTIFPLGVSRR